MKRENRVWIRVLLYTVSFALTLCLLTGLLLNAREAGAVKKPLSCRVNDPVTAAVDAAREALCAMPKSYWITDETSAAPEPNPACYGTTDDPGTLQWLLDAAEELLEGQQTCFTVQTQIIPGTAVTYYLDETIFCVTWKEAIGGMTYTVSEVKIADASQFRRFLAGGEYGSSELQTASELACSVNAVVASAGDFYTYRQEGAVVYDGSLKRTEAGKLDTCFVDRNGELLMVKAGELESREQLEQFVREKDIRFSLAFGPVLIRDGVRCDPWDYPIGEIKGSYSRAGIGQKGKLHYILTTVNGEYFHRLPSIYLFTSGVEQFGCDSFYALDGGQTATIVMNGQVVNRVDYGGERAISDIIYFATAVPNGG